MAPDQSDSLKGFVAAYLQGGRRRPRYALSYAERLARLEPRHKATAAYVGSFIAS